MIFHIYVHCYMSKNKSENAKIYFHFHFHILVWAFYDHIRMKICLKFDFHRLQSSFYSNNINICRNVKYYCGITFNSQVYSVIFHCQLWTGSLRSQLMLVIIHMKSWNFLDNIKMIPMSPLMKMNLKEIGLLHCHSEFYSDNMNVWTILRLLGKSVFIFKLASS